MLFMLQIATAELLLPLAQHALWSRRGAFDPRPGRLAAIGIITRPRAIGMSWNVYL